MPTMMIFSIEARYPCSIEWPDGDSSAQDVDNWTRFLLDFLTLIMIIFVSGYLCLMTSRRIQRDMKLVYV